MPADVSYAINSYKFLNEVFAVIDREGLWQQQPSLAEVGQAWVESFIVHLILVDGQVSRSEVGIFEKLVGHPLSKQVVEAAQARLRPDPSGPVLPLEVPPFLEVLVYYDKERHGVLAPQALTSLCTIALCISEADKVVDEEFGVISRWRRTCLEVLKQSSLPRYGALF